MSQSELTELEYLRLFYEHADFGPAHEDVVLIINENIETESGKRVPIEYRLDEDD